uniref:Uncharacterized protein n=1 Tax=Oryza meridionalis TaxID=40149 RepID=A0A0E0C116_9ORYZ
MAVRQQRRQRLDGGEAAGGGAEWWWRRWRRPPTSPMAERLRRIRGGGAVLTLVLLAVAARRGRGPSVAASGVAGVRRHLRRRRGACDAYLVFRFSPPLYASAVSISNLLNVTATTGGEVVRGGDGGAPELEEELTGALRPRHLPTARVAVAHRPVAPLPLPVAGPHRLILGTHTSHEMPNHLLLADAALPLPPRLAAAAAAASGAVPAPSVSISRSVPHKGEVNRARCMPQRPYTVATKTCVDEVHVYHLGDGGEKGGADVVLKGHEAEGYGLAPAQSTAPFQVSISTSRSTIAVDVPTRGSATSPSRGFAATLTKMTKGGGEREMRKGEKRGKRERRLTWIRDMWGPCGSHNDSATHVD